MTQKITSQYFHFSKYQIQRSHHAISDLPVLSDVAAKWDETLKSLHLSIVLAWRFVQYRKTVPELLVRFWNGFSVPVPTWNCLTFRYCRFRWDQIRLSELIPHVPKPLITPKLISGRHFRFTWHIRSTKYILSSQSVCFTKFVYFKFSRWFHLF